MSDITGRDNFIIGQALYRYIQQQQDRPLNERSQSDIQDAKDILLRSYPTVASLLVDCDEKAGKLPADLRDRF